MLRRRALALTLLSLPALLSLPGSAPADEQLAGAARNQLASPPVDASFDYLYVEANQGGSSGGHVAIRFGDRVYHFRSRDGLLVLERERWRDFVHAYALLENRTIHLSRIAVSAQTRRQLRERFNRQHHAQARQLEVLAALGEDLQLVESWIEADAQSEPEQRGVAVDVDGAGYFLPAEGQRIAPALARLRERIVLRHGAEALDRRRDRQHEQLDQLSRTDPGDWLVEPPGDAYQDPPLEDPYSRRYSNAAAGLVALDVLARAPPLRPGSFIEPTSDTDRLSPDERDRLREFSDSLAEELVRLVASRRDDWGRAFLIGMARLAALERSQLTGRWVLLDVFPEDAARIDAAAVSRRNETLRAIRGELESELAEARRRFFSSHAPGEREWASLERMANRTHELERALRGRHALRLQPGPLVPSRSAAFVPPAPVRWTSGELSSLRMRLRGREHAYRDRLVELHRYRLISHNCVSELFSSLNNALSHSLQSPGSPDLAQAAADALGGHVDGRSALRFIPFVSAAAVNDRLRVVERKRIPSFREARLREMKKREHPLLVAVRESNTLTATSYRRSEHDSFFLFFTERSIALRPLFGAINLLAGVGESIVGLAMLPVDRGETLGSGLRGAAASLPELAFGNIRKGSNDWVARDPAVKCRPLLKVPTASESAHRC